LDNVTAGAPALINVDVSNVFTKSNIDVDAQISAAVQALSRGKVLATNLGGDSRQNQ
jgi:hypothetical protein